MVPSTVTTWGIWREIYLDTRILSAENLGYDGDLPDPYAGYFSSGAAGLSGAGQIDSRLPAKELVIGVVLGENIKAYSLDRILKEQIIIDQIGDFTLSIVWDETHGVGRVFLGNITRDLLENGMIDFEPLTPIPAQLVYWFAWTGFYPESKFY